MRFKILPVLFFLITLPSFSIEEDIIYPDFENIPPQKLSVTDRPYALGDFKGFRTKLEDKGINIQSSYIIDSFVMRNQTKKSTKGTYQGLYNLSLDLDFGKMEAIKGGKFHILYQVGNKGTSSAEFLNSYSDINSYNPIKSINQISELYYEQSIKDDLFNLKIGKQDANVDFQALDTGFEFLNLSFSYLDNTPIPLFPSQQMGVRARLKLPNEFYIQNGFYDGNLDIGANPKSFFTGKNNYLNMTELYKLTDFKGKEGKFLIGNWIKTGKYDSYKNEQIRNNYGLYAGFDQKILNWFEDNSGGINVFGQFGYARNSINDVPYYGGGGLVFKGITKKRKGDSVGLAFGWHQFDKALHNLENKTAEKVVELFYKIKITEFLYIQPDIQYIIKPNGTDKNAFALGIRSSIVF